VVGQLSLHFFVLQHILNGCVLVLLQELQVAVIY
jgi:hypothetical protein